MFCYEIGNCPRCGSQMTGRLKQGTEGQKYFMMGSPVIYTSDPGAYNCACALCGVQWVGTGKMVKRSLAEIKEKQNEWGRVIDDRPEYTRDEESEIAKELYHGVTDSDAGMPVEKGGGIIKKFFFGAIKQTNKQGKALADDFWGMTSSNYYAWQDDVKEQQNGYVDTEEEDADYGEG